MTSIPILYALDQLLKNSGIAYDSKELALQIQGHPSFPSLRAITGVLDHFNIDHVPARIPKDKSALVQLPNQFIAQYEQEFHYVELKNEQVRLYTSTGKKRLSYDEFLEGFDGVVVVLDHENSVTAQRKVKPSRVLMALALLLLGASLFLSDIAIAEGLFLLLALAGTVFSFSILKQEQGQPTLLTNTFCPSGHSKIDCEAVTQSDSLRFFKQYSLSDLAMAYFSATSVIAITSILTGQSLLVLAYSGYLVLPVTLYSIYYQQAVVKKWCALCLGLVAVLWLQALTVTFLSSWGTVPELQEFLYSGLIMVATAAAWTYIKPFIDDLGTLREEQAQYLRFRRDPELFSAYFYKEKPIDTSLGIDGELQFGNPAARLSLVVATSPQCSHCQPVHELIEKALQQFGKELSITLRFNIDVRNEESPLVQQCARLLELYHTAGKETGMAALQDAYSDMPIEQWMDLWGSVMDPKAYYSTLMAQKKWCLQNAVNFTPHLLINGRAYPKMYQRSDLLFFIEELLDQSQLESLSPDGMGQETTVTA